MTTTRLAARGYDIHDKVINTRKYGLPQNRPRYWVVGIIIAQQLQEVVWPQPLEPIQLQVTLTPRHVDLGRPTFRPTGKLASSQVEAAAEETEK